MGPNGLRRLIQSVEELGGVIGISEQSDIDISFSGADLRRGQVEYSCSHAIRSISLFRCAVDVVSLKGIACVGGLKKLRLVDVELTDELVGCLCETKLQKLYISGCRAFDDSMLAQVAKLRSLEYLTVNDAAITGQGVASLRQLGKLKYLSLRDSSLTDDCVDKIACLRSLVYLECTGSALTPMGIRALRREISEVVHSRMH